MPRPGEKLPFLVSFDRAQEITMGRFFLPNLLLQLRRWLRLGEEAELPGHVRVMRESRGDA